MRNKNSEQVSFRLSLTTLSKLERLSEEVGRAAYIRSLIEKAYRRRTAVK